MIETARGQNYVMSIDTQKNRVRVRLIGDLVDAAANNDLPAHLMDACSRLAPGFTCLADFTEIGLLGLPDIVREVQETLVKADLRKIASVWTKEGFAKVVIQRAAEQTGAGYSEKRKVFSDLGEAEAWLDE